MADVAVSRTTTYVSMADTSQTPLNVAPAPLDGGATADRDPPPSSGFALPSFIVQPIESALGTLGKLAGGAGTMVGERGMRATSKARSWLEFFDLSAFKLEPPPQDGAPATTSSLLSAYSDRLRLNIPYFLFNYIILGLALTVVSVITKPVALIGAVFLIWTYFQFFGAETAEGDFRLFGFSLDTQEKVGCMLVLGLLIFWLTAGGVEVFFSVFTATLFVALIHGVFRKPASEASAQQPEPQVV